MEKLFVLVKKAARVYKNLLNIWGNELLKSTPYGIA